MKIEAGYRIVVLEPIDLKDIGLIGNLELVQKEKPEVGKVLAVGRAGKTGLPVDDLKVGEIVAYRHFGETAIMLEGKEHKFVSMDDIICRLTKEKK